MDGNARVATIGGTLLATLVGLAAGLLVASDGAGPAADVAPGPEPATRDDLARVAAALDDLAARVDALTLELSRPVVPPSPPEAIEPTAPWEQGSRGADAADGVLPEELVRWMRDFERRVALAGASGPAEGLRVPAPGYAPNPPPFPRADDESGGLSRDHFAWRFQDVLDTYGRPDVVHTDGDIEWEYKYTDPSRPEELDDVHFVFVNGLCMKVYAH